MKRRNRIPDIYLMSVFVILDKKTADARRSGGSAPVGSRRVEYGVREALAPTGATAGLGRDLNLADAT